MTARRRKPVQPASAERAPSILLGSPAALVRYVPAEFDHGPRSFLTISAARTIQTVARARWRKETGGGHPPWRIPALHQGDQPIPRALVLAGEDLADELLQQ